MYIEQLNKYAQVDVYGRCGKPCPPNSKYDCKKLISDEYKFYLSFENSICKDYITEKFFNILNYNIIPVVLGGGNYDYYVILIINNFFKI
jgi:hypothetical protein